MAQIASANPSLTARPPLSTRPRSFRVNWNWIGVVPFMLFITAFMLFPALSIIIRSFLDNSGQPSLQNIASLNQPIILGSFSNTIQISLITAVWGGVVGFLVAWAVTIGGLPGWVRSSVISFSGVASNFAGIPLAFAFSATIGKTGVVTKALDAIGISLYQNFTLYGYWGLCLTYTYFQIPLMILIMTPAIAGLRREWREAAENLGATRWQYWRFVALPILLPSVLGSMALLFANAFGTHATAFALVGGGAGQNMVVSVMVGSQFSTDGLANPGLGNALAFGMVVVIALTIFIYAWFRRQAERWLKQS